MTKSNERTTSYRKWMREAYTHNAGWTLPELATFISGADDRTSEAWVDAAIFLDAELRAHYFAGDPGEHISNTTVWYQTRTAEQAGRIYR